MDLPEEPGGAVKPLGRTDIPWADYGWSLITGCSRVSPGCDHCYAQTILRRFRRLSLTEGFVGPVDSCTSPRYHPARRWQPFDTRRPGLVFVAPLGDLLHERVPAEAWRDLLWAAKDAPYHTYAVLTKRPENLSKRLHAEPWLAARRNVWWGVTVEQQAVSARVNELMSRGPCVKFGAVPSVKFVSCEPLLGPVDFDTVFGAAGLSWVIVGCESGPGRRPCKLEWVREIVEWCRQSGVLVWVKQLEVDGRVTSDVSRFPEDLRLQQRSCLTGSAL